MNLDFLNDIQKEAVLHTQGPMMILAGAGSGKTRTLVTKIEYLLREKKTPSSHILAMTFSNRAAREMRDRIEKSLGEAFNSYFVTTFHSFCARLLRAEAQYLGLSKNFTIYDDSESKSVIKAILAKRGISQKEINPAEVKYYISELKNRGYFEGQEEDSFFESAIDEIDKSDLYFALFKDYERELHTSNALDFGGLIVGVLELFSKHPKVLERYQKRFKYVLVDEYQDTNKAQFYLVRMLSQMHKNICVVGDEDQSIYSWRGADIRNILDFENYFPELKTIKLEQNYRSSKTIIDAASFVIGQNQYRKGKKIWTENEDGEAIKIIECQSDINEADFVAKEVRSLSQTHSLDEMAVFYRNNAQSRMLEDALRKAQVPYKIIGGIKFYERKEVKDALSYLKLIQNTKDSLSLSRVINAPTRGIGAVSLRKLEDEATRQSLSLFETIKLINEKIEDYAHLKLSKKVKAGLQEFATLIEEVRLMDENGEDPSICCEKVLQESGYLLNLKSVKSYENQARIDNLKELLNAIQQYEISEGDSANLSGFIESVTLDQSVSEEEYQSQLSLMTIHSSKGLEYECVFVVGVEENIFPSSMSLEEGDEKLEEERRLFYVAMTRAMSKLYLCIARSRMLWGKLQFQEASRFLYEIPEEYFSWVNMSQSKGPKKKSLKLKRQSGQYVDYDTEFSQESHSFDESDRTYYNAATHYEVSEYTEGLMVYHNLYGEGVIVKTQGHGKEEKVTIRFKAGATKKFLTQYASIEIMSK